MAKTKIEWCDETVNFITGCVHSCDYCYARGTAERNARMGVNRYLLAKGINGDAFAPVYHVDVYDAERARLLRAQRPRVVFIGSMSDFAQKVEWHYSCGKGIKKGEKAQRYFPQHRIVEFCNSLPQHRFILLTKRVDNILPITWPSNVLIGTSVARHGDAVSRIPPLLAGGQNDAPVFKAGGLVISVEPLQGGASRQRVCGPRSVKRGWGAPFVGDHRLADKASVADQSGAFRCEQCQEDRPLGN